ncbi:DUF5717 family protein [Anaerosacchariphilus polymeriproducens]|uniref:DUF5717 domain-containing protein n=1 Tax=Anaerosacchariphilus polymeriproducens TaxID=1812858 RepID=A0A371ARY5_9FIRM|nr:DUF5717 family protein [Anaerosacchariphilus polymeriproducens]RDU22314.1 hypothetical protein DWV06_13530 [Anaerosacchariphilus polymeriproducens]
MYRSIKELANGIFQYEKPRIKLSDNQIILNIPSGSVGKGKVQIQEAGGNKIKGIIYSSNPRMICLVTRFEGENVEIPYEYDTKGLVGGDVQKGKFYIVSNGGEYTIPYEIMVESVFEVSSIGEVKNLFHFANLAQTNWDEAFRVFYSKEFAQIFEKNEREYKLLYESFSSSAKNEQNMEAFLIAINKKSKVEFQLDNANPEIMFENLEENISEKIVITKNNWGYLYLEVKTDMPFIQISKSVIQTNDFVGKSCIFEYIIEFDKLHAGKNFGKITFSSAHQSISYTICVKKEKDEAERTKTKENSINLRKLLNRYIQFRMKSISAATWAKDSLTYLERLHNLEEDNHWYELFQAQVRIINQQVDDARWLLERYALENEKNEQNPDQYGYFLYLTTLCNPEKEYINKITQEVQMLYQRNRSSWRLLWILLYLDEELENNRNKKLQEIEQQIEMGCSSPVLYIEAYYVLLQDSYMLNRLGKAQLKIISWIIKQGALNQEMAGQLFHLASREKKFSPLFYRILDIACEKYGNKEHVGILCGYLIKNDMCHSKYFKWYAKAVEYDLRITRLYEYFMMSLVENEEIEIPQIVLMYFQYNNQLDYRRKAFLYAYIIKNKERHEEIYRNYRPIIERFTIDQILEQHLNENLGYLYKNILTDKMLTVELATALSHLLFMHKIICTNNNMKYIVVSHSALEKEQVVPLIDGKAYISIFTDDYEIMFQDKYNRRYGKEISYQSESLLPRDSLYQECLKLYPYSVELALYYFEQKKTFKIQEENNLNILFFIEKSSLIKDKFKKDIRTEIIQYYYQNYGEYTERAEEFFLQLDDSKLDISERAKVIEILIMNRQYEKAMEKISQNGWHRISAKLLLRLCTNFIITEEEQSNENEFLVTLVYACVKKGKYNDIILKYLVKYFQGTLSQMIEIWELAKQFETETIELSQRIIIQILFTKEYTSKTDKIFEDYYHNGAGKVIKIAYFAYFSYEYFVRQKRLPENFDNYLLKEYLRKEELNEICKLCLLKSLSEKQLNEQEENVVKELLEEYIGRDLYFKFYQNFPINITNRYQLNDKLFIEYSTNPKSRVEIHYMLHSQENKNSSFIVEDMPLMYEGIFVKMITMFFGENLQYYITEISDKEEVISECTSINKSDLPVEQKESKYDLLNEIILSVTLQDDHTMIHMMERFMEREFMSKHVFNIR